jgi:hypothetical protein
MTIFHCIIQAEYILSMFSNISKKISIVKYHQTYSFKVHRLPITALLIIKVTATAKMAAVQLLIWCYKLFFSHHILDRLRSVYVLTSCTYGYVPWQWT